MRRSLALLVAGALLTGTTACSETADDRREAYCAQVKKDSAAGTDSYYNLSWALFSTMMMSGNFVDLSAL